MLPVFLTIKNLHILATLRECLPEQVFFSCSGAGWLFLRFTIYHIFEEHMPHSNDFIPTPTSKIVTLARKIDWVFSGGTIAAAAVILALGFTGTFVVK